ncbi:MAG: MBL fold metallo-hydrolase [Opitutaceae bacterium]|nr:MBL fold metallo-hydrolase [Opitutaceae bacterium]
MPRIPLEDNFNDVIAKAQRGLRLDDAELARRAGISPSRLQMLQSGTFDEATARAVAPVLRLGAGPLVALGCKAWYPERIMPPRGFAMFNTPYEDMTVNSYLVWDPRTRLAAAFDTGATCEPMLGAIETEKLAVRYLFLTHTHEDHVADTARLVATTGAEIFSSEREPFPGGKIFRENQTFHLDSIAIKTLLTCGHSPGQTTYFVTGLAWPLAICGDSMFASSMGGGLVSYEEQYRNNVEKIFTLPRDTVIAPGHGPLTTLAQEKKHNPFFARSGFGGPPKT